MNKYNPPPTYEEIEKWQAVLDEWEKSDALRATRWMAEQMDIPFTELALVVWAVRQQEANDFQRSRISKSNADAEAMREEYWQRHEENVAKQDEYLRLTSEILAELRAIRAQLQTGGTDGEEG